MRRKPEISFLNTLFCLLVIFIHVASEPVSGLAKDSAAYACVFMPWRLSAFVVQGFIFLSGAKMFLSKKRAGYPGYCLGRIKTVVVPYVFSVCLFYAYFVHKGGYFDFNLSQLAGFILNGMLVSHFYFVVVIVQFYFLRPVWELILKKVPAPAAIFAALIITLVCGRYLPDAAARITGREFIYNDRIFTTYIIYWIAGCYAGANYEKFRSILINGFYKICVLFAAAALAEALFGYLQFSGRAQFPYLEQLHLAYCCAAIIFCYAVSFRIGENVMKSKILGVIDRSSYYIYLIHPLVIFIVNDKIAAKNISSFGEAMLIRAVCTYTVTAAVCGIYTHIKKKRRSGY